MAQTVVPQSHGMKPNFVHRQQYYNPTLGIFEMDDMQFKVSEEDKALNRKFYAPPRSPQILWIWGDAEGRGV